MRRLLSLYCLALLLTACHQTKDSDFASLFDGQSWEGWEGPKDYFRIEDGAIVAGRLDTIIPLNQFLCTEREYEDFELRMEVKFTSRDNNAGIQFRSRRIPNDHEVIGYQADVGFLPERPIWGSLYDESRRRRFLVEPPAEKVLAALRPEDWNDYRILCRGPLITFWLNDHLILEYEETEPGIGRSGSICVQIHSGSPAEAWYRNIEIRELPTEVTSPPPPNLILIMADDLGHAGIGCFGNTEIRTPNLDQLAATGMRLTQYYANSTVCTPTRAALLTGRYQQRCGLEGVIYVRGETRQLGMAPSEITLAELLRDNGYATGIMGKWHLGYRKAFFPTEQGFDEFYGYVSGNIDFHTHYDNAGIYDWWHNQDSLVEEGYVTDLITEHATDFIEEHRDRPFFLYLPHEAPHAPFQGRDDPGYRFPGVDFSYYGPVADKAAAYREMVEVMDEGIGKIMDKLQELGLDENTLVVFVSDNGAEQNYGHNGDLRGWKTNLFEGGIRVPGIVHWPGRIEAGVSDVPVMSFDWMPTFLALAGADLPPGLQLDGQDLSGLLLLKDTISQRPLFWRYRGQKVVRNGEWKLLADEEQGTMLFNLEVDPNETTDLASEQPELVQALSQKLAAWEREMDMDREMITE